MMDFIDIEDWFIIGPLAEELADEEREKRRIERDYEDENNQHPDHNE